MRGCYSKTSSGRGAVWKRTWMGFKGSEVQILSPRPVAINFKAGRRLNRPAFFDWYSISASEVPSTLKFYLLTMVSQPTNLSITIWFNILILLPPMKLPAASCGELHFKLIFRHDPMKSHHKRRPRKVYGPEKVYLHLLSPPGIRFRQNERDGKKNLTKTRRKG